ncbi:hypothetical protein IG197_27620 [Aminobacter sp. SR38]|jgi:hypothetical protein|uniref:hypothetical protein n=1 Tax=Aminobacter sp. SR38 TaxID=2774562 RepID=UPI001780F999|nr:hypothetical protein [Aminobacter sp. SR38]QOF71466.1 hypothetical protein IG197_27620 [Aminobacter sp. SR38]
MAFDGKAFGAEIVDVVKDFMSKELAPLAARMADIEQRLAELPAPKDGKDADMDEVRRIIGAEFGDLKSAIEAIAPAPEMPDIAALVSGAVAALPAPQDGKSVTAEDLRPLVEQCVAKAVEALPVPKDGNPGKDGVGLAGALIDRAGNLVVTLTDGTTRDLGPVLGKDGDPGQPGKDGKDGFNLEDFDATVMDDGRTVLLSFERSDLSYKIELGFPVMLYRGVFTEREYERGDTVTWAGSLWHCDAAKTTEKPGEGSSSWTLAAKRGRDGKDGTMKAVPEKPIVRV